MEDNFSHFCDLISAFGNDTIKIQDRWNQAHEKEFHKFKKLLHVLPPHIGKALITLHPKRQVFSTISLEHCAKVAVTQELTAEIKLKPLNLGYEALFKSTVKNASRVKIIVEQIPINQERN